MTSASFKKLFFTTFPELSKMDWSNVCVRGGAIVDMLLGRPIKDLDLFIHGLGDDAAVRARAAAVLDFLLRTEREAVERVNEHFDKQRRRGSDSDYDDGAAQARTVSGFSGYASRRLYASSEPQRIDISATRHGPVITARLSAVRCPLQVVLCGYASIEAVAHGVDMHVCGTLFNGERVLTSPEGQWALENMAIRIPDGRFPKMARLAKYFAKGFDVVLPGLDVEKLPKAYLALGLRDAVVTPAVRFSYSAVAGNRITLDAFLLTDAEGKRVPEVAVLGRGSYDVAATTAGALPDRRSIIYSNLALLAGYVKRLEGATGSASGEASSPVPEFSIFAEADYVGDVLKPWPDLTPRQVENTYAGILAAIWDGERLAFGPLARFVTVVAPHAVLADVATGAASGAASLEVEAARAVGAAVDAQKAASAAALPALEAYFADKAAPVLSPGDTFLADLVSDPAVFYGAYARAR